jgi:hypothetical protein
MKNTIDKIIDILEDYFDDYDEIAMQDKFIKIATKINQIVYTKEFVEWKDDYSSIISVRNGIRGKWYGCGGKYFTLDELHQYWLDHPELHKNL